MAEPRNERVVLRRKSFPVVSWLLVVGLGSLAAAAAGQVSSGAARGPLIGVAACLITIALVRRIMCSRIVLEEGGLKVVNPVLTYWLPYRLIAQVGTAVDGTLTLHTVEAGEVYATAFGGSVLDHFLGTSDRAVGRLQGILRERKSQRVEGPAASRKYITVSWLADGCLVGAVGVLVAASLASG